MERPALQRLLADIGAGKIDCVATYHYSAGSEDASMPPLPVGPGRLLVATLVIPNHLADLKGFGRAPTAAK